MDLQLSRETHDLLDAVFRKIQLPDVKFHNRSVDGGASDGDEAANTPPAQEDTAIQLNKKNARIIAAAIVDRLTEINIENESSESREGPDQSALGSEKELDPSGTVHPSGTINESVDIEPEEDVEQITENGNKFTVIESIEARESSEALDEPELQGTLPKNKDTVQRNGQISPNELPQAVIAELMASTDPQNGPPRQPNLLNERSNAAEGLTNGSESTDDGCVNTPAEDVTPRTEAGIADDEIRVLARPAPVMVASESGLSMLDRDFHIAATVPNTVYVSQDEVQATFTQDFGSSSAGSNVMLDQPGSDKVRAPVPERSRSNVGFGLSPNSQAPQINRSTSAMTASWSYSSFEPEKQEQIRRELADAPSVRDIRRRYVAQTLDAVAPKPVPPTSPTIGQLVERDLRRRDEVVSTPKPRSPPSTDAEPSRLSLRSDNGVQAPTPTPNVRKKSLPGFKEIDVRNGAVFANSQPPLAEILQRWADVNEQTEDDQAHRQNIYSYSTVLGSSLDTPSPRSRPPAWPTEPGSATQNRQGSYQGPLKSPIEKEKGSNDAEKPLYQTFWGVGGDLKKPGLERQRDPPTGSAAAIQRSLRSVPNSPTTTGPPMMRLGSFEANSGHAGRPPALRNVRDFYNVWGRTAL